MINEIDNKLSIQHVMAPGTCTNKISCLINIVLLNKEHNINVIFK